MTECPDEERLAEFIDGKLSPGDRQTVVSHLVDCKTCYTVVSDSLTIREELSRRSSDPIRRVLRYAVPSALAAAILLLVVRVWQPAEEHRAAPAPELAFRTEPARPSPHAKENGKRSPAPLPRSFAGDLAARLGNHAGPGARTPDEGTPRPRTSFGFSSAVPRDKAAFRIGLRLTRLEVARQSQDGAVIEESVRQLTGLLKPVSSSYGITPPVIEPQGASASVEALYAKRKEAVYLKLGAWVEAAGLAAEASDAAFFRQDEVRAFADELGKQNEPVGTLNDLAKLESIISSGDIRPDQFKAIARLLADVREMF